MSAENFVIALFVFVFLLAITIRVRERVHQLLAIAAIVAAGYLVLKFWRKRK